MDDEITLKSVYKCKDDRNWRGRPKVKNMIRNNFIMDRDQLDRRHMVLKHKIAETSAIMSVCENNGDIYIDEANGILELMNTDFSLYKGELIIGTMFAAITAIAVVLLL